MNEIAIPTKISDICGARDSALMKMRKAYDLMESAAGEISHVSTYAFPLSDVSPRISFEKAVKEIDSRLWRFSFDYTGLMQIMDAEAKRKFMDEVERSAPPFTIENIRSTFLQLSQEADTMFSRGLVNVFLKLSKDHKTNTNEPFKVNERAILSWMVDPSYSGGFHVHYREWASSTLNDIDRVFKVLDGHKHVQRALEQAINDAWKDTKYDAKYEDDYFQIRGYRNGNMHINFKRADLLEKANRIIHDYYKGQALAAGRKA